MKKLILILPRANCFAFVIHLSTFLLTLVLASPIQAATVDWTTGDGDWFTGANWSSGNVPGTSDTPRFGVFAGSPGAEVNVAIGSSPAATHGGFSVGLGKTVQFTLADGAVFSRSNAGGRSDIGISGIGTGSGAAHALFSGPEVGTATVYLRSFYIGSTGSAGGNSMEFEGNLIVETTTGSIASTVGQASSNNLLALRNGVSMHLVGSNVIGNNTTGNQLVVDRSTLNIDDVGSSGGRLAIGAGNSATGNSVLVEGTGALISVINRINDTETISLGTTNDAKGNILIVRNGGEVQSSGKAQARPQSQFIIGPNGTFVGGDTITIGDSSLLQLAETGVLRGADILNGGGAKAISLNINGAARFEVAGAGLDQSVSTNIASGTTLAVGLNGGASASVLELQSFIRLRENSVLELTIFGSHEISSIDFKIGGTLLQVDAGAKLRILSEGHDFTAGDSYQLFSNTEAASIVASNFSMDDIFLPGLPEGLTWDLSLLNQAGGWQIMVTDVIPEPQSAALIAGLIGILIASGFVSRR